MREDPTEQARRLRAGWQAHLEASEWSHLVTLTTRFAYSADSLLRLFRERFVRRLTRMAQRSVIHFVVAGRTHDGREHLHALLMGTEGLSIRQLERAWPEGFTRIERFDPVKRGAAYVVKGLGDECDNYDVSRRWTSQE